MKRPSTLAQQVRRARKEFKSWPKAHREMLLRDIETLRAHVNQSRPWPRGAQ